MCGRFEIHSAIEIIARLFGLGLIDIDIKPNYNVAPSQDIAVVLKDGGRNRLVSSRWGFVPSWSREMKTGYPMINARAETVADKRTFRSSFENNRCLVIADGFYEWKKTGSARQPYYIHLKSGEPFAFAGLYSMWTAPDGEPIRTSTIITTDANDLVKPLHDRMPVILPRSAYERWLDPAVREKELLLNLLTPVSVDELEAYLVTTKVNSYKNNDPENIKPV